MDTIIHSAQQLSTHAATMVLATTTPVAAASAAPHVSSVHSTETLLFFVLLQLALIVLAGRVGGILARRFGQSSAAGEIIVGILLGPSLFGWMVPGLFNYVFHSVPPQPMFILAQLGLVLLMFHIGMEFNFSHLREKENQKIVSRVALASLLTPFALGFGVGFYSAEILSPGANPLISALLIAPFSIGTCFSLRV